MRLVRVAVPVPALDALTYRVPEDLTLPVAGARVLVPLGKRIITGLVVDPSPELTNPEPPSPEPRAPSPEPRVPSAIKHQGHH